MNIKSNIFNFNNIIRVILNIICLASLIYQTNMLLTDFMSGATVISIRVGPQNFDSLPGITICAEDAYIGFGKLLKNDPNYSNNCHDKMKELKNLNMTKAQNNDKIHEFYRHYIRHSIYQIISLDVRVIDRVADVMLHVTNYMNY